MYRSFLFAPGNHARKVLKVFGCGADNVILDLEDAVAKAEKVATRALVVEALKRERTCGAYIRVNAFSTEFCYGDAVAVVGPGLDGIILPMVESREQIVAFDWLVGSLERERGLSPGAIDIIPIIETGKGIANARAIAAAGTRVKRMAFGAGDYPRHEHGMDARRERAGACTGGDGCGVPRRRPRSADRHRVGAYK